MRFESQRAPGDTGGAVCGRAAASPPGIPETCRPARVIVLVRDHLPGLSVARNIVWVCRRTPGRVISLQLLGAASRRVPAAACPPARAAAHPPDRVEDCPPALVAACPPVQAAGCPPAQAVGSPPVQAVDSPRDRAVDSLPAPAVDSPTARAAGFALDRRSTRTAAIGRPCRTSSRTSGATDTHSTPI
jgi:hypothetical protein